MTVATRGSRPVDSACSSILEAAIRVVISVSAATPAPQQLRAKGWWVWTGTCRDRVGRECLQLLFECGDWAGGFLLDFGGDEVDLLAVFVRHDRIVSGPRIGAQDNSILQRKSPDFMPTPSSPQWRHSSSPALPPCSLGTQVPRW